MSKDRSRPEQRPSGSGSRKGLGIRVAEKKAIDQYGLKAISPMAIFISDDCEAEIHEKEAVYEHITHHYKDGHGTLVVKRHHLGLGFGVWVFLFFGGTTIG